MSSAETEKQRAEHVTMDTIVSLCKRRGIIFPGSEIYGGLQGTFDYGPVGVELKKNVRELWWRDVVHGRDDVEGLECAILMNPNVWRASGHVDTFTDPLCDSLGPSKKRYRADHIEETECTAFQLVDVTEGEPRILDARIWAPSKKKAKEFYRQWWEPALELGDRRVKIEEVEGSTRRGLFSPDDGAELTEPRPFNLMFKTHAGPVAESGSEVFLRPETAQGMFVNFENVLTTMRRKLPLGIAQIGRSFRNEITPRNFIFRTREFEQMEMEFFIKPPEFCSEGEWNDEEWHDYWIAERLNWYVKYGIRRDNLRLRAHAKDELAHYSKAATDVEYLFPLGWQELEGIANRTNFDLGRHMDFSGKDLQFFDPELKRHYIPYVIEPAAGVDRSVLAFLVDAYHEEEVRGDKRVVLRFNPAIAPFKAAVFPLLKNRPELVETAKNLAKDLRKHFNTVYDDTASIGKLYRRQDEVGTPFCVTVDVDTMDDQAVTIRDRDTMEQERISLDQVRRHIQDKLAEK